MKKRILLVYPCTPLETELAPLTRRLTSKHGRFLRPTLPTLAALTPVSEFDVQIRDEAIDDIDPDGRYDIVGMSVAFNHLWHAKRLARLFRDKGSLVVLGGVGTSVQPERWRETADVLIIGEAERLWPAFLADYLSGRHLPEYRETERFDLSCCPLPDYRPVNPASIRCHLGGIVQTSRGCPHLCEFCSVPAYLGRRPRFKPTELVIREIDQLHRMGFHSILLADDSFAADRPRSKEVLRAIAVWNKAHGRRTIFSTQLAIDVADDDEFLSLAMEAGLCRMLIGFESVRKASLRETRKHFCVERNYEEDIRKLNGRGMVIFGASIVGFDSDDLSTFREHFDFFMKQGIHLVNVWPLQALDGSDLKARAIAEGRYVDPESGGADSADDLSMISTQTIRPKNMSIAQLQQGTAWLLWNLYEPENMVGRLRRLLLDFEESPRRREVELPPLFALRDSFGVAVRLLRYLAFEASPQDRADFFRFIAAARGFSHPHRYSMAVSSFLVSRNMQHMVRRELPHVRTIEYPT